MLTQRQKRFADAVLLGDEPETAFREAGYREKNVSVAAKRLLAQPTVQAYMQQSAQHAKERQVADAGEVLQYLTLVLRGEHGGDRERLRAAELLGKRHGLFSDKPTAENASVTIVDDLGG